MPLMQKVAERRRKSLEVSPNLDPEFRALLAQIATGRAGYRQRHSSSDRRRSTRTRPEEVDIPSAVPIIYAPPAVLARLRKDYGFFLAPRLGWRHWRYASRVRELAETHLGIRVSGSVVLVHCPTCSTWSKFLQLEGDAWRCPGCAVAPARGLYKRLGWLACYLKLGLHDRHVREMRCRLVRRVMGLAFRVRTINHVIDLALASQVIGTWPLNWTGPRRSPPRLGEVGHVRSIATVLHHGFGNPVLESLILELRYESYGAQFMAP